MADQNFLNRGLQGMRQPVQQQRPAAPAPAPRDTRETRENREAREAREGRDAGRTENKGGGAIGRTVRNAVGKAKAGLGKLKKSLGFDNVDAYEDDAEDQRRRKRARELLGDDEPTFAGMPQKDMRRDLSTVAPEFRGQVSSGLAAANSMTAGSTLVDGGKAAASAAGTGSGNKDPNGRW